MRLNLDFLSRKKSPYDVQAEQSNLARVLTVFDLTVLGRRMKFYRTKIVSK